MTPLAELACLLKPAGGGLYLVSTGKREQQALQRRYYGAEDETDVTQAFLAALERVRDAKVVVLGVPSDTGAGFRRGANLGPQALRHELVRQDSEWLERQAARGVVDVGDVFVVPQLLHDEMLSDAQLSSSRLALYPELSDTERAGLPVSPLSVTRRVVELLLDINPGLKPFAIGGDHSVAWPIVEGLHSRRGPFCIVQPDAHTDLLEERLGIRYCFATWTYHANELLQRGGRVIQVGIRASQKPKEHWEGRYGVRQFWAEEIARDPEAALDHVVLAAKQTGLPVYLSNDIDGTDAAVADACGTPEPDGLEVEWLRRLIRRLGDEVGLVGADLMELAPGLGADGGQRTVEAAAAYVQDSIDALLQQR
jgi:agmatinase